MRLYSSKQTVFRISKVILDGYTNVPSFETKSELIASWGFCGDLAKMGEGICHNVIIKEGAEKCSLLAKMVTIGKTGTSHHLHWTS